MKCIVLSQASGGITDVDKLSINGSTREELLKFFEKRDRHPGNEGKTQVQCFPLMSILKAIGRQRNDQIAFSGIAKCIG